MRIIDASHAQTHSREKGHAHAREKDSLAEREERQVVLSLAGEAISFRWAASADASAWMKVIDGRDTDAHEGGFSIIQATSQSAAGDAYFIFRESALDARELTSCPIRNAPQLCPGKMPVLLWKME